MSQNKVARVVKKKTLFAADAASGLTATAVFPIENNRTESWRASETNTKKVRAQVIHILRHKGELFLQRLSLPDIWIRPKIVLNSRATKAVWVCLKRKVGYVIAGHVSEWLVWTVVATLSVSNRAFHAVKIGWKLANWFNYSPRGNSLIRLRGFRRTCAPRPLIDL